MLSKSSRQIGALFAVGLIAAVLGVGCGGGDGDGSTVSGTGASGDAGSASGSGGDGMGRPGESAQPGETEGSPEAGTDSGRPPDGSSGGASDGGESSGTGGSGSGEGGESGGPPAPAKANSAKAKFIERANTICSRRTSEALQAVAAQVRKKAKKGGSSEGEVQAEAIHTAFLPTIQAEIEELERLTPPPGDEEEVEAFLAAFQEDVDETMDTQYTSSSVASFGSEEFRDSSALAAEYGISGCQLS